jgi:4'-phosphopantetheinyl transferase
VLSSLLQSIDSPESDVRIWAVNLNAIAPAELHQLDATLDSSEHTRAARFYFEHDRRHYVAARGLLRHLLGSALDQPASGLVFGYGPHGKPALSAPSRDERTLCFNLSHSGGWAMFALSSDREVGIDLESAARLDRDAKGLADLAGRVLSGRELEFWQALPDAASRERAFLRAWTRKEAFAKANGEGLFEHLIRTEVALDAAAPKPSLTLSTAQKGDLSRHWILHDLPAPDGFAAALAVEQKLP